MKQVDLVITDLDNTLYDWVTFFVPALDAMVGAACAILGTGEDELLDELRAVHQLQGSSEHPFALLETKLVSERFGEATPEERRRLLDPAFHAFNSARKRSLQLYPGVNETLDRLKAQGTPVVAYTDARPANSLFRILRLGLLPLLRRLYAPRHPQAELNLPRPGSEVPEDFVFLLPAADRKPNPQAVLDICRRYGVPAERTLFVGDSLSRDVMMARQAGAISAWARYGTEVDPALWDRLVRVSHWTPEDVLRENELRRAAAGATPDVILTAFSGILDHFAFTSDRNVAAV